MHVRIKHPNTMLRPRSQSGKTMLWGSLRRKYKKTMFYGENLEYMPRRGMEKNKEETSIPKNKVESTIAVFQLQLGVNLSSRVQLVELKQKNPSLK